MKRPLSAFALLLLAALGAAAQNGIPRYGFQVNRATQGSQMNPALALAADGEGVAVWIDQGTSPLTVKAALVAANSQGSSLEIVVASAAELGGYPRVAIAPDGAFAVVWDDLQAVHLRRFDPQGAPLGDAVTVSAPGNDPGRTPDVALDPAGNAVVVWARSQLGGDAILLQRFTPAGTPLGAPEPVNPPAPGTRQNPRLALGAAGSLLVSWDDDRATIPHVYARRFDGPSGAWAPEARVGTGPGDFERGTFPLLDATGGGGAVLFFDFSVGYLGVRRFDAAGAPLGGTIRLSDLGTESSFTFPSAATDRDGTTLAVWQGTDGHVQGELFDRAWQPAGAPFAVSSPDPGSLEWAPAVAASPGNFLVMWNSGGVVNLPICPVPPVLDGADGSELGIFAVRLQDPVCDYRSTSLCLGGGQRFTVQVAWRNPYTGETGMGRNAFGSGGDTGVFWFFDPNNLELMIKVLDGRAVNGNFWVFYGSLSNLEYTVTVTDTVTGAVKTYHNAPFQLASRADVDAFPGGGAAPTAGASPQATASLRTSRALTPPLPAAPPRPVASLIPAPAPTCIPSTTAFCAGQRFRVEVLFTDPRTAAGGKAQVYLMTNDTAAFWFFDPGNLEVIAKVLDGSAVNGHFWVFYGGLSDLDYTLQVTDTVTGTQRSYHNPQHHLASVADIDAFAAGN